MLLIKGLEEPGLLDLQSGLDAVTWRAPLRAGGLLKGLEEPWLAERAGLEGGRLGGREAARTAGWGPLGIACATAHPGRNTTATEPSMSTGAQPACLPLHAAVLRSESLHAAALRRSASLHASALRRAASPDAP